MFKKNQVYISYYTLIFDYKDSLKIGILSINIQYKLNVLFYNNTLIECHLTEVIIVLNKKRPGQSVYFEAIFEVLMFKFVY